MSKVFYLVVAVAFLVGGFYAFNNYIYIEKQGDLAASYKEVTVRVSEEVLSLGGAAKYFGNEARGDFNADGVEDVAFLITYEPGGSGTFFYLTGAIKERGGYRGIEAVLIGDRIAPQTTEYRDGQVIVNYADRKPGEPFTAEPSLGQSLHAVYNATSNSFDALVEDPIRNTDQ